MPYFLVLLHQGQGAQAKKATNAFALAYVNDPANNLIGIGEGAFGFDFTATVNSNNQIDTATFIEADQVYRTDANGNVLEDAARTYEWDAENRLIAIKRKDNGSTSQFGYDGLSRRIRDVEIDATTSVPVESRLLWCGEKMCLQRDANDAVTARYFPQGEQHFSGTPQALYYAQDHLGSVIGTTDQSGAVLGSAQYTPYGRTHAQSGTQADFGYAAMYQHGNSDLYLTYYRAYDSQTGRWLNRDPIEEAGGINLYGYVGGNPISNVDPLGLATYQCTRKLNHVPFRFGPLYHQYVCTGNPKDGYHCGGLGPSGNMFDSPGVIESDAYSPDRCTLVRKDDPKVEACVQNALASPPPNYSINLAHGENCQTYASGIVAACGVTP